MNTRLTIRPLAMALAVTCLSLPGYATAGNGSAWRTAVPETDINAPAPAGDGCPIESWDGRELYIASNRPGTLGGNDIWSSHRRNKNARWSTPRNVGQPINSMDADFCPTPLPGGWLLFVTTRTSADKCGDNPATGDIHLSKKTGHGWTQPLHLGCAETGDGPNTAGSEFSPSLVFTRQGVFLYFSSDGYDSDGDGTIDGNQGIFASRLTWYGFGPAKPIASLNTEYDDRMPNVRIDGLEMVFSSNRPHGGHGGSQDVYVSRRQRTSDPWGPPTLLGPEVNTAGSETRASLSGDGKRLHFGRDGDVYVSTRHRVPH